MSASESISDVNVSSGLSESACAEIVRRDHPPGSRRAAGEPPSTREAAAGLGAAALRAGDSRWPRGHLVVELNCHIDVAAQVV